MVVFFATMTLYPFCTAVHYGLTAGLSIEAQYSYSVTDKCSLLRDLVGTLRKLENENRLEKCHRTASIHGR